MLCAERNCVIILIIYRLVVRDSNVTVMFLNMKTIDFHNTFAYIINNIKALVYALHF